MNNILRPALYSVSSHQGFADSVAAYFLNQYGRNPLSLTDGLILLPNNRAISAIEDAFIRQAGKGLLLPRMVAIGDSELNEKTGVFVEQFDQAELLQAINPMQRIMFLAKLIEDYHKPLLDRDIDSAHSVALAMDLARAIDQLDVEEIAFERFEDLPAKAEMAAHWQKSYALFENIYKAYNQKLKNIKLSSMAVRRNGLIRSLADNLDQLSHHPFVAAIGITTAAPAITYLLRKMAICNNAMVIFPHIDSMMEDDIWNSLGPHAKEEGALRPKAALESHPQFHLKLLLDKMGFERSEVRPLGETKRTKTAIRKDQLVSHIFSPAKKTAQWQSIGVNKSDFNHLKIMTSVDSASEAQAIAILVRRNLEISGKRIAIVTPDRELAGRISAHLLRWNVKADDSAGIALADTPSGSLLLQIARTCANGFAPIELLSLLKHPLVKKGDNRIAWLDKVRTLDLVLRGPRIGQGLEIVPKAIKLAILRANKRSNADEKSLLIYNDLADWWAVIASKLQTILSVKTLEDMLKEVRNIADYLSDEEIWKGEAGRELSGFYTDILSYIPDGPSELDLSLLPQFIHNLMGNHAVRTAFGNHPRVAIYGLLEARLQRSDMVICAGLNEGVWPQKATPDPWLAPGIRRDLGLPSLERNIGLSAHDLAEAIGAKELILSRSERGSAGPSITSRFLLRLMAFAGGKLNHDYNTPALVTMLDKPEKFESALAPKPKPNIEQRNLRLNVTDMDKLKADPFAFYAGKIMGLVKLEEVDAEASAAWRGTRIHTILEKWVSEDNLDTEKLIARTRLLLEDEALHSTASLLWQPRLLKQVGWVAQKTLELIQDENREILAAEASGQIKINGITVKGMADRIDRLKDGGLAVIDYKSGGYPSLKQIKSGFALQLGLLGYLAENECFKDSENNIIKGQCGAFEYWTLQKNTKGKSFGKIGAATLDIVSEKKEKSHILTEEMVSLSLAFTQDLIDNYILKETPFEAQLHPEYAPYNDYVHLSRLMEWYGREDRQ